MQTDNEHGFLDALGNFTPIDVSGAGHTNAYAINDSGKIVGVYQDGRTALNHGFLDAVGNLTPINVPGAYTTVARGINDSGMIVGDYSDYAGWLHGFLLDTSGNFTSIDVPGAYGTWAYGINDSRMIVGVYMDARGNTHGFLRDRSGNFTEIIVPDASFTAVTGINDSGKIVGFYGSMAADHGFVATPVPEPVSIDIEPWFKPNIIDLKFKWAPIPVAILSKPGFDAPKMIDQASLTFGDDGNENSLAFCSPLFIDVNGDRLRDLICFFYTGKTGFLCGDTEGILMGKTKDGKPLEGSDSVKVMPCK